MATGRSNKLVGQVGEFLVCAELGREGFIATPFAGNVPEYDLIATDQRCRAVPIQVKTINGGSTWQFNVDKFLEIEFNPRTERQKIIGRKRLSNPNLIYVLTWLGHRKEARDRFFVLTKRELRRTIHRHYAAYLDHHDGRRPQNPKSRFVVTRLSEVERYEDRWELVTDQLRR